MIELEKVFLGNPALYKSLKKTGLTIDDKIKRFGSFLSTGDILATSSDTNTEIQGETYNTWAVHDVITDANNDIYKSVYNYYKSLYLSKGYDEETSIANAKRDSKAYKEINESEGQVFVTPQTYREILLRLGEWGDNQAAYELLINGRELTDAESKLVDTLLTNPLKLIHEGSYINDGTENYILDKMSIAMLSPRVLANTKMGVVLELMQQNNVQMLKFEGSVKSGIVDITSMLNENGDANVEGLNKLLPVTQNYKNLRRQSTTAPHHSDRTKTATQFIKIPLSNINKEALYVDKTQSEPVTGQTLINNILTSLSTLSNFDTKEVFNELGIKDENYTEVDTELFAAFLRKELSKGDTADHIIRNISTDENGDLNIALDTFANSDMFENKIVSSINKAVINRNLPGGQLIQIAGAGMSSVTVREASELRFLDIKPDGSLGEAECSVSVNLFKNVLPNYANLTYDEKVEMINALIPTIIGYRVPVQGASSVIVLKVVKILPESYGDAVILPVGFTALTGADFDVDKLFVVRHNYRLGRLKTGKLVPFKVKFNDDMSDKGLSSRWLNKVREAWYNNKFKIPAELLATMPDLKVELETNVAYVAKYQNESAVLFKKIEDLTTLKNDTKSVKSKDVLNKRITALQIQMDSVIADKNVHMELVAELELNNTENKNKIEKWLIDSGLLVSFEAFTELNIFEQNTKAAVENKLFDTYAAIMTSANNTEYNIKPNGSLKDGYLVRWANETESSTTIDNLLQYTPSFQADIKLKYATGKSGIGPFALNNSNHSLTQTFDITFKNTNDKIIKGFDITKLNRINGYDNIAITEWLSALIDAHVDIAKDPYIAKLNVNKFTYSMVATMIRCGMGGEATFKFIAQPILKEAAMLSKNAKGVFGSGENNNTILTNLHNEYKAKLKEALDKEGIAYEADEYDNISIDNPKFSYNNPFAQNKKGNFFVLDKYFNAASLARVKGSALYYHEQLNVLSSYSALNKKYATPLNQLVLASRIDTNKAGNTIAELELFVETMQNVLDDDKFNNLDKMFSYNPETNEFDKTYSNSFIGTYVINSIQNIFKILNKVKFNTTIGFRATTTEMRKYLTMPFSDKADSYKAINAALRSTVLSKYILGNLTKDTIKSLVMGDNSVARRLYSIQHDKANAEFKDYIIFDYLNVDMAEVGTTNDGVPISFELVTIPFSRDLDPNTTDLIMYELEDMAKSENEEVRNFVNDLIIYSFLTSGFKRRFTSFFEFISPNLLNTLIVGNTTQTYGEYVKQTLKSFSRPIDIASMFTDYIMPTIASNHNSRMFVPMIPKVKNDDIIRTRVNFVNKAKTFRIDSFITLTLSDISKYSNSPVGSNIDGVPIPPIYYKHTYTSATNETKDVLFRYIGFDRKSKAAIYKQVTMPSVYSKGRVILESAFNENSISDVNTALYDLTDEMDVANLTQYANKLGINMDNVQLVYNEDLMSDAEANITEESEVSELQDELDEMVDIMANLDEILDEDIEYTDDEGQPCAARGLRNKSFTKGGTWEIIKEFKGASHERGGIDIEIGNGLVKMSNKAGTVTAASGLVIAANGLIISENNIA
jgi:hypothetical protein